MRGADPVSVDRSRRSPPVPGHRTQIFRCRCQPKTTRGRSGAKWNHPEQPLCDPFTGTAASHFGDERRYQALLITRVHLAAHDALGDASGGHSHLSFKGEFSLLYLLLHQEARFFFHALYAGFGGGDDPLLFTLG